MKEFSLYGASDDLVEIEVTDLGSTSKERAEEVDLGSTEYGDSWTGVLFSESTGALQVLLSYESHGVWSAGVCQVEEGQPIPDWSARFRHDAPGRGYRTGTEDPGYSTVIVLVVPDDTVLTGPGLGEGVR